MTLIPVYFNIDGEVSKALVKEHKIDFYLNLGAKRNPHEAIIAQVEEIVDREESKKEPEKVEKKVEKKSEGNKGFGEPNSIQFHEHYINNFHRYEDIRDYVVKVTGKTVRRTINGNIEKYRKNAIRLIKGHLNVNQSG